MRWVVAIAVSLCLLLPGATVAVGDGPAAAGAAGPARTAGGAPTAEFQTAAGNATTPDVTIEIAVREQGDARWTVSMRFPLATETERQAFERLAGEFRRGDAGLGVSAELFRQLAASAGAATGREMAIVNESPTAFVVNRTVGPDASAAANRTSANESAAANGSTGANASAGPTEASGVAATGVLAYEFTWTNFAAKRGDELVVRDVFEAEAVTRALSLAENQTLVIRPPDRYLVSDATVGVTNGTLVWHGARRFEPGSVSVVYRVAAPPGVGPIPLPDGPVSRLVGALVALLAVGGVVYLATRATGDRSGSVGPGPGRPGGGDGGDSGAAAGLPDDAGNAAAPGGETGSGSAPDPAPARPGGADAGADSLPAGVVSTADDAADAGGVAADDAGDAGGEGGEDDQRDEDGGDGRPQPVVGPVERPAGAAVDPELLSDEERVLRLLDARGGRMRQSQIVDGTGWSNAKVSVLLSSMAAEGRVEKLRIGRENLISLPDVDPEPERFGSDPEPADTDAD